MGLALVLNCGTKNGTKNLECNKNLECWSLWVIVGHGAMEMKCCSSSFFLCDTCLTLGATIENARHHDRGQEV